MIFITGFTRGGTSWLQECVAFHPLVQSIPPEMPLFRDYDVRQPIERALLQSLADYNLPRSAWYANKAPVNAPFVEKACRLFPESKVIFIIRDPRDVLVSHQRGTKEWMGGSNSTVEGCMKKIQQYYDGYIRASQYANLLLVRYEDLHQNFYPTISRVYEFIGLSYDGDLLKKCYEINNFVAASGRKHKEDRDAPRRKGVVGDWANHLTIDEVNWYMESDYWKNFLIENDYRLTPLTFKNICSAIKSSDVNMMTVHDLIHNRIAPDRVNIMLLHDIDSLRTNWARESVLETARIEGELGLTGIFNFLPLDDTRYQTLEPAEIINILWQIKRLSPLADFGLHFNATERFFPAIEPDYGNDHPYIDKAIAYLHKQVDAYAAHGIKFRFATAHGYGRGKKLPNNRDTPVFSRELKHRGISLFETELKDKLAARAGCVVSISDVGGALSVWDMPTTGALDHPETYTGLPQGTLLHFLTHPGNYDVRDAKPLGTRIQ